MHPSQKLWSLIYWKQMMWNVKTWFDHTKNWPGNQQPICIRPTENVRKSVESLGFTCLQRRDSWPAVSGPLLHFSFRRGKRRQRKVYFCRVRFLSSQRNQRGNLKPVSVHVCVQTQTHHVTTAPADGVSVCCVCVTYRCRGLNLQGQNKTQSLFNYFFQTNFYIPDVLTCKSQNLNS